MKVYTPVMTDSHCDNDGDSDDNDGDSDDNSSIQGK